jgi:hypothetical protein
LGWAIGGAGEAISQNGSPQISRMAAQSRV